VTRHALLMAELAAVVVRGISSTGIDGSNLQGGRARDQLINYIERNQFITRVQW
jgi:hypothetical protein